jgi:hypothetical protein
LRLVNIRRKELLKRIISGIMMALLLASSIALAIVAKPVKSEPTTTISLDPPTITVPPNTNFTVNINITDVTDLIAWSLILEWDPSLLEMVNITKGSFCEDWTSFGYDWNQSEGVAFVLSNSLDVGSGALSGSGTLAEVTLHSITLGQCDLNLTDTSLINKSTNLISTPPYLGDANGDMWVDSIDLGVVLGAFGYRQYNVNADFNSDGIIDAYDVWCVVVNYMLNYNEFPQTYQPVEIPHQVSHGTVKVGLTRDVSITNVTPYKTVVGQGYRTIVINVTVQNQGDVQETFNVSATYNQIAIPVELWPDGANTETFHDMGDVNRDGYVDYWDVLLVAAAFGSGPGDPDWNVDADLNNDEKVDMFDAYIVTYNFGRDIWTTLGIPKSVENHRVVTLASRESTNVPFRLNTTDFAKDTYIIEAYAEPVPDETDTADNNFTNGMVKVTLPGDITEDEAIWADMQDIDILAAGFMATPQRHMKFWHQSHCDYCPHGTNCDVNIDMADIQFAIDNFMTPDP